MGAAPRDTAPPGAAAVDLLLVCDLRGRILTRGGRDAALATAAAPGETLARLVADAGAAFDLLFALRQDGAVFGRPLALGAGGEERTLRFAGVAGPAGLLLAGDRRRGDLAAFCRRLGAGGGRAFGLDLDPEALAALRRRLPAAAGRGPVARARLLRRLSRRLLSAGLSAETARLAAEVHRLAAALADELAG
jgi:hypothetical protein